jgi:hypothetical protein
MCVRINGSMQMITAGWSLTGHFKSQCMSRGIAGRDDEPVETT